MDRDRWDMIANNRLTARSVMTDEVQQMARELLALQWRRIGPDDLPKLGDEIGGWFDGEFAVCEGGPPINFDAYQEDGFLYCRPINPPKESA